MKLKFAAISIAVALSASQAQAQTSPITTTIPVTFTGTVTSTAADTIMVRQPDGSLSQYTGPLPDLPYRTGDQVTISFNATLPTKAFYDSSSYTGQKAADGIYRISLSSAPYNSSLIGVSSGMDVSGPISPALNSGQPNNTLMTIVYDYNTDSYSIEGGGNFFSSAFGGPGLIYDAASGKYVACSGPTSCQPNSGSNPILFGLRAGPDGTTVSSSNIAIASNDPSSGTGTGFFSWLFSGSWNLPQFTGGPVKVPEPEMLGLFAAGFGLVALRRCKRIAA